MDSSISTTSTHKEPEMLFEPRPQKGKAVQSPSPKPSHDERLKERKHKKIKETKDKHPAPPLQEKEKESDRKIDQRTAKTETTKQEKAPEPTIFSDLKAKSGSNIKKSTTEPVIEKDSQVPSMKKAQTYQIIKHTPEQQEAAKKRMADLYELISSMSSLDSEEDLNTESVEIKKAIHSPIENSTELPKCLRNPSSDEERAVKLIAAVGALNQSLSSIERKKQPAENTVKQD